MNNRAIEFLDKALQALKQKRPNSERAALFVDLAVEEVVELQEQIKAQDKNAAGL